MDTILQSGRGQKITPQDHRPWNPKKSIKKSASAQKPGPAPRSPRYLETAEILVSRCGTGCMRKKTWHRRSWTFNKFTCIPWTNAIKNVRHQGAYHKITMVTIVNWNQHGAKLRAVQPITRSWRYMIFLIPAWHDAFRNPTQAIRNRKNHKITMVKDLFIFQR